MERLIEGILDIRKMCNYGRAKYLTPCAVANVLKYHIEKLIDNGETEHVTILIRKATAILSDFIGLVPSALLILVTRLNHSTSIEHERCWDCGISMIHKDRPNRLMYKDWYKYVTNFIACKSAEVYMTECFVLNCKGHNVCFCK